MIAGGAPPMPTTIDIGPTHRAVQHMLTCRHIPDSNTTPPRPSDPSPNTRFPPGQVQSNHLLPIPFHRDVPFYVKPDPSADTFLPRALSCRSRPPTSSIIIDAERGLYLTTDSVFPHRIRSLNCWVVPFTLRFESGQVAARGQLSDGVTRFIALLPHAAFRGSTVPSVTNTSAVAQPVGQAVLLA